MPPVGEFLRKMYYCWKNKEAKVLGKILAVCISEKKGSYKEKVWVPVI